MAKKNKLPLLGALAATPVMTASVAQAQTFDLSPGIAGAPAIGEATAMKLQLLTLTPGEKLSIAGDRVGGGPALGLGRDGDSPSTKQHPKPARMTAGPSGRNTAGCQPCPGSSTTKPKIQAVHAGGPKPLAKGSGRAVTSTNSATGGSCCLRAKPAVRGSGQGKGSSPNASGEYCVRK